MIIGIGCDIVEHDRAQKLNWEFDESILKRIFSENEIELSNKSNKKNEFLSGRFAGKEAVLKCLGTGMQDGISLTDVQILQSKNEKPIIELRGVAKTISDKMKIINWHITISHSDKHSVVFAIAEKL